MSHTPGPWRWVENDDDLNVANGCAIGLEGKSGPPVLTVNYYTDGPNKNDPPWIELSEANACLIAAAPELLAACEDVLDTLAIAGKTSGRTVDMLRSAIAKANGRTS